MNYIDRFSIILIRVFSSLVRIRDDDTENLSFRSKVHFCTNSLLASASALHFHEENAYTKRESKKVMTLGI